MNRLVTGGVTTALLSAMAVVSVPTTAHATDQSTRHTTSKPAPFKAAAPSTPAKRAQARAGADRLVAQRPAGLRAGSRDRFVAHRVVATGQGLQYVPYDRTYAGLPVVGGDFVVATDAAGKVLGTTVAQTAPVRLSATTATLSRTAADRIAQRQLTDPVLEPGTRLVVLQRGASHLAWESTVRGTSHGEVSRQSVYVDARTGKVLDTVEHVADGTGTGAYDGPNPLSFGTTKTSSGYSMTDPNLNGMPCQNAANNSTFTGPDDVWGNGSKTDRETGCVDALFVADKEDAMLAAWDGRNGMDGNGGAWPIRIGLDDENAYYDGTQVQIGHNTQGQWIPVLDVLGHEMGHGVDDHTPGGISGAGTQEFVADTFGAATEWYANEPSGYDSPDFTVGESVNLVGSGPIRYMYDPSKAGDANCYSSSTPNSEVHSAAGPGNHWFYLLAEGTSPSNGQPTSPTCNGSTISGIGIAKAEQVMYNAMLMKTSSSSYLKYRTWTLTAAKNLDSSCATFNTVKAAWNAVSVPAQSADPTCGGGGTTPPPSGGQLLANPGFESGASGWTGTSGPITNNSGRPAHAGSWKLWLGGNGATASESESQTVTIPASAASATLSYWIRIDTAETTTSRAYDTAKVQVTSGGTTSTLASYSNLSATNAYAQKSFDLSAYRGKSVTVKFSMSEDSSAQTSFVVDDTALNAG